jgi:Family of unknown function (DUF6527)
VKAQPLKIVDGVHVECSATEATWIKLEIPVSISPLKHRLIPVITHGSRRDTPCWTWNGDVDFPTLKPSIRTRWDTPYENHLCHSFVTDGKVHFLDDCTHENSGKTMDLLEIPDHD